MAGRVQARAGATTPLRMVALGLLVTFLDPLIAGYDAVPDVAGWALVVGGLLAVRHLVAVSSALPLAVVAAVVSVALLRPEWAAAAPESTGWWLSLPQIAFSIALAGALAEVVPERLAKRLRGLRWAFAVAGVGPVLLYGGGIDALLVPLALLAVGANLYLAYLVFGAAAEVAVTSPRRSTSD